MAVFKTKINCCVICDKRVISSAKSLNCSICRHWVHLSCTSLSINDFHKLSSAVDWYCVRCLEACFPFNSIVDDLEFANCIYNLQHFDSFSMDWIKNVNQLSLLTKLAAVDSDIDPDKNFLKANCKHSAYFLESEFNKLIMEKNICNSNFSCLHVNIRSLNANIDKLQLLTAGLMHSFSVICVTETWTNEINKSFFNLPGYNCITKSRCSKIGGGVAIYVRDDLPFTVRNDLCLVNCDDVDLAFIQVKVGKCNFNVGVIYRPPDQNLPVFNNAYSSLLDKIASEKNVNCVIAGDFNINLLNYDTHTDTENFLNDTFSHYIYPTINHPTRFSHANSTLIDNIFINNITDEYLNGILISDVSDHLPVFYISKENIGNKVSSEYITSSYRDTSDTNIAKFADLLSSLKWDASELSDDVNKCYSNFMMRFKSLYDQCFPIISKRYRIKRNVHKPWISRIIKSITRKNKLYKVWLKTKTLSSLEKFKKYRKNKLVHVIRVAEKQYYASRFKNVEGDTKQTWKLIKSVINNNSKSDDIREIRLNSNSTVTDPVHIANKFNEYFVNVGKDLARKIPEVEGSYYDYLKMNNIKNNSSLFLQPVDTAEVVNIVRCFKSNKAAGYDEISPKVIKAVAQEISQPLSDIFNISLVTGVFPDDLKTAKISPIFKSDDKLLVSNYRPISVLPIFSKILEKIMHKRLIDYLNHMNILTDKQFGFREKYSTSMALLNIIDKISDEIDKKKLSLGVFIDLSKAFDTINHKILLNKLYYYGIRGKSHDWLISYLSNRQQYVQIKSYKSSLLLITCGVPQGSILGPLLFIIYINDIVNVSTLINLIMFADDTNIFFTDSTLNGLENKTNEELNKISIWFKLNKLSLNINKTNFILFHTKSKVINYTPKIIIDNTPVAQVKETKFLGVVINESLTWNNHLKTIKQKVTKNLGIIRFIKNNLPLSVLKMLYLTLIQPYFEYCNIVWAIHKSAALNDLIICQKKAIRIITNSKWNTHTKPLFYNIRILPIDKLNDLHVACFMYRAMHNLLPWYFCSMFVPNLEIHSHNTRIKDNIHSMHHRLNLRKHTIIIHGPTIWNNIQIDIRNSQSYFIFKRKFKESLFTTLCS